jgi:hypothetical protein
MRGRKGHPPMLQSTGVTPPVSPPVADMLYVAAYPGLIRGRRATSTAILASRAIWGPLLVRRTQYLGYVYAEHIYLVIRITD